MKTLTINNLKPYLGTFSTDTTGQLNILWHNGYSLSVNGTQVGIFEKTNQVGLCGFLEGQNSRSLESEIGLEILGNLTYQTLEGKLTDEQIGTLLVPTNLTEGDGSGSVTVGLLYSPGGRGGLAGCLGSELLAGSLSSGRLAGSLLLNKGKFEIEKYGDGE